MANTIYIQGQSIIDHGDCYEVYIHKPIYGHCVALNEDIIKTAKRNNRLLLVRCPGASQLLSPDEWVWKSKRVSKVFRRPDCPMILYQGYIGDPQTDKNNNGDVQLTLV